MRPSRNRNVRPCLEGGFKKCYTEINRDCAKHSKLKYDFCLNPMLSVPVHATNRKLADSSPAEVNFWIYLFLPAALGPGVYSASNRKEYQKHKKNNVSESKVRRVRRSDNLTATVSRLSRQCRILNISQPYRPPRPVTGITLLYGDGVCFLWDTYWTVSTVTSSQYLAVNCEPII
jgi:hypothetical protein